MKFIKKYGFRLVGILFGIFLYLHIDIGTFRAQIQKADIFYFFIAVICVNTVVIIQAWRGYILLGGENKKLNFGAYFHLYFVGMAASAVMPGRLGAVIQVPLLRRYGVATGIGIVNILYDKLSDLAGFLSMGAIFAAILASSTINVNIEFLVGFSILTVIVIWYIDVLFEIAAIYIKRLFPRFMSNIPRFRTNLNFHTKIYAMLLTIVRLCGAIVVHWLCARAAGIIAPLYLIGACAAFGAISTLIPVSVMGVGLREGIFLMLFAGRGVPDEQVLTFAFLLLIAYLTTAMIGTLLSIASRRNEFEKKIV